MVAVPGMDVAMPGIMLAIPLLGLMLLDISPPKNEIYEIIKSIYMTAYVISSHCPFKMYARP